MQQCTYGGSILLGVGKGVGVENVQSIKVDTFPVRL